MRRQVQFTLLALTGLLLFLGAVPAAQAHRPVWGEEGSLVEIPDLTTSWAYYRDLRIAEQVDFYSVEGEAGEELSAGISIPAIRGLENYTVSVAVVGPGLPEVDHDVLPAEHPEDLGAVVYPSSQGEDFFEPFTQTNYWGRQRLQLRLPSTGTYYVLVWNPAGERGKYVLDVGTEEVFGVDDIFRFPVWWFRVHDFFGHTPYIIGGLVLLAGGIALAVWLPRRRRSAVGG